MASIGSLVWASTKGASDREEAFDMTKGYNGPHLTGLDDIPSSWRNGRAPDYRDRAALLLLSL